MKTTLGGERLGSGSKQIVSTRNYERSTHDLSYLFRSTMACGTLVPFMNEIALPGDTFDIDLNANVLTHPTIGPLFGRYKVQLDVFCTPIRLYQAKLHNNSLNVGMKMSDIKLPVLNLTSLGTKGEQINPSSLLSYLNIRGLMRGTGLVSRSFNGIGYLNYYDIYKNYFANKSEGDGVVIHNTDSNTCSITAATLRNVDFEYYGIYEQEDNVNSLGQPMELRLTFGDWQTSYGTPQFGMITMLINGDAVNMYQEGSIINWNASTKEVTIELASYYIYDVTQFTFEIKNQTVPCATTTTGNKPALFRFPLENIDTMRDNILAHVKDPNPFVINDYNQPFPYVAVDKQSAANYWVKESTMEGLAIKTYQSDLFNNWVNTEWIDGENGINAITAVDTSDGNFTIDALNLSKKVYDMLNRISVSGGSYDDWLSAVYEHNRYKGIDSPVYLGGLIKELAFQEVISNAAAVDTGTTQPLGTLAGRGVMTNKHKGGKIYVKVDEPSYIMGIVSITPLVDYSQGNKWNVNLKTMDDFHKPQLDEIGFQELITDQMHWKDTTQGTNWNPVFKSAGKQPAWINYMTNVNVIRGNFAKETEQMFMVLDRRYETDANGIKDLTTYIDPSKFSHIFSDTRLDAQNFWTQISCDITARRKMSARQIPNL